VLGEFGEQGCADRTSERAPASELDRRHWSQVRLVEQLAEPAPDRIEIEIWRGRETTAEHEQFGVEHVGEIGEPERHPTGEVVDHRERLGVAVARSGLDVLAAHRLRVAAGVSDHVVQAVTGRRLAGEHRQS
jgi:hypothetical protein